MSCFCRLCGFEPFYSDQGDAAMYARILKCDYEFLVPYWDDVSLNAKVLKVYISHCCAHVTCLTDSMLKDLISKLLILDPSKRLTAKEALNHPWVQVKQLPCSPVCCINECFNLQGPCCEVGSYGKSFAEPERIHSSQTEIESRLCLVHGELS